MLSSVPSVPVEGGTLSGASDRSRCAVSRPGKNDPTVEVIIPAAFARLLANAGVVHKQPNLPLAEAGLRINVRVRFRGVDAKEPASDADHDSWADFA
jgi:hypothetical protein